MYDGRVIFQIDADTKSFDNQIEKVKEELNDLLNRYDETKNMKSFKGKEEDLRQLGVAIEQANNKLFTLRERARKAAEGTSQLVKESKNASNSINLGFGKSLKTLKKVALGIIGVRSAYMAARKAASAYMAQDEELSSKMQSVWVGLGSFLAPLLEMITNLMLKFVGYLNEFIKALTGTDYIARANAKALEKQAKAQAKLNKETEKYQNYDFDVIRTQQSQTSSESGSSADTTSGLIEIPELNQKIVKKLQDLAKWLRENKELIEGIGIALGITFGAVAIGKILGGIATLIGSGALMTGLLGLLAVLSLVAVAWEISLVFKGFAELKEAAKIAADMAEKLKYIAEKTGKEIVENPDEKTPEQIEATENYQEANESILDYYNRVKQGVEDTEQAIKDISYGNEGKLEKGLSRFFVDVGAFVTGKGTDYTKKQLNDVLEQNNREYQHTSELLQANTYNTIQLAKQQRLSKDGLKFLLRLYKEYGGDLKYISDLTDEYKFNVEDVYDAIQDYAGIYPDVIKEVYGLGDTTKSTGKQIDNLIDKFSNGKISIFEFSTILSSIPKEVKTTMKSETKQATTDTNDYKNTINSVPSNKDTKMNADEQLAKKKIAEYEVMLNRLPKTVSTQLLLHFDSWNISQLVEEFKQKFKGTKFGDAFANTIVGKLMGFAGGGYVSQPTLAMVGEGKYNEYVIPDGEDYISKLASEIGQYGGGGGTTNIYLDGRLIQRQINNTEKHISFTKNK